MRFSGVAVSKNAQITPTKANYTENIIISGSNYQRVYKIFKLLSHYHKNKDNAKD